MFFNKYPSPANFSFAEHLGPQTTVGDRQLQTTLQNYRSGVAHLAFQNEEIWPPNLCLDPLDIPEPGDQPVLRFNQDRIEILNDQGEILLTTVPRQSLGLNAKSWLLQIQVPPTARYYGMGQKTFGKLELSGYRSVFYNVDVWSDFHSAQWGSHPSDPSYFSLPYLAVKVPGKGYVGFLIHDPSPTFMETPGKDDSRVFVEWQRTSPHLILGAYDGEPNLWVIVAPTLRELTQKLNRLVGVTPTPPLWSLGYHQSRWGYGGDDDLTKLDQTFKKLQIPCSGLWLDLDYMDGYRIFTVDKAMFPKGVAPVAEKLAKNGRRIVPIIDPGIKSEPGYPLFDDGLKQNAYCQNREGFPYIGMVWPGQTVFPDFTQVRVRDWWAGYAKKFLDSDFGACWVDMNDPSTGPVNPDDMLFDEGRRTHAEHRNQYALGMQMATHQGFLQSRPNERPFILSRSGFIGSSRYAAIWTGDNLSNDFYLHSSVPTSLGMSLSGHVFNGPDVGGFGGDTNPRLIERWFQTCFLYPFFRNHNGKGQRDQEPFAFPQNTCGTIARYIRLRYRLLPYLYNLFAHHEKSGEPVLRPLFYEFEQNGLDEIDDQFMVGPFVLQAPILAQKDTARKLRLPGKRPWFDTRTGEWTKPGTHSTVVKRTETPLYLREGTILPLQPEEPTTNDVDLRRPLVLIAVPEGYRGTSRSTYVADDGLTFDYQQGQRSEIQITIKGNGRTLQIEWVQTADGFGPIEPRFVTTATRTVTKINQKRARKQSFALRLTGKNLALRELV